MFETCPGKVNKCQQSEEYESFEAEFLIDIKATIPAMEEACPLAQMKSLKSCPVFGLKDMPDMDNGMVNSLKYIRVVMDNTVVHENTLKATDEYSRFTEKKVFENDSNIVTNIDAFHSKTDDNASVVFYDDVNNLLNLFWNNSETNNMRANISLVRDIFGEENGELSRRPNVETSSTITTVMISLTILFTTVFVIVCAVRCSQSWCRPTFRLRNQKFIRRL